MGALAGYTREGREERGGEGRRERKGGVGGDEEEGKEKAMEGLLLSHVIYHLYVCTRPVHAHMCKAHCKVNNEFTIK